MHQIALVREQILSEPKDGQIDPGDERRRDQSDDIEHDQHDVQQIVPDILLQHIHLAWVIEYCKLQIKASYDGDDDQSEMQRDH